MNDFQPTAGQKQAVELRGVPVLVSAAAGSGKTRVLTERLMARIAEGEDITRFLVITFTKAAAAELRSRILTELNDRLAKDPGNRRLRRQSAQIYRAQIGTIDSFCASLVREHAHLLAVSPGFAVLDQERGEAMRLRALEDVLDSAYASIGENDGFRMLADTVGSGRDDSRLADIVLSLHDQLQSRAWPEKWAEDSLAMLDAAGVTDAGDTVWGRYILDDLGCAAAWQASELEAAVSEMAASGQADLFAGYIECFSDAAGWCRGLARAAGEGWDSARRAVPETVPRLKSAKKGADEALKERVKPVWERARSFLSKKTAERLNAPSSELLADLRATKPALRALVDLAFALDREYGERKRRADACDFSDVAHLCIRLLCEENSESPSPLADRISARFAEVMVDEYQDVNAVQELIFRRVSGDGRRLFMVGDVKQSIYRFRLAEPEIFNRRLREFAGREDVGRVLLRENFRSRGSVLDACNAVFERIMSPSLGDIRYDEEARLVRGAVYPPEGELPAELCILDRGASSDDEDTPDARLAEARYVARRIAAMVGGGTFVSDGAGGVRPVRYGDIAVLLRTPGTTGSVYRRAMAEAGIPLSAAQGGSFFSQPEVSFALAVLKSADNPRQDIPLIAAMRGLPFAFTPDELTAVRKSGGGDLWDAVLARAETDEKCARFVSLVRTIGDLAREAPLDTVLRRLCDSTGLPAACSLMPDAAVRHAALMKLIEYARRFEADGGSGLFRFLLWLDSLEESGAEPPILSEPDAVQLMSIHKSKGLEFPVVFLADNAHQFRREGTEQVLCHGALGIGMQMTDAVRGVRWPTLPWRAIGLCRQREALSEQERVLYVAMTRARERLIMTCSVTDPERRLASMPCGIDGPIDPQLLNSAVSDADWLMRAAAADNGRTIDMKIVSADGPVSSDTAEAGPLPHADPQLAAELSERLRWQYPHGASVALPSKLTATGIGQLLRADDPEAAPFPEKPQRHTFRVPAPGAAQAPVSGAERGTAAHLVMQYIDFSRTGDLSGIRSEIDRLHAAGRLDDRQAASVSPEDILAFFRSDIGRRVLAADRVDRELRFSLLCPAQTWYPDSEPEDEILLQGVCDCVIEEHGVITVIDFKTDAAVEPEHHTAQMAAYIQAMRRVTGRPVSGAVLWYLRHRQAVEIPAQAVLH